MKMKIYVLQTFFLLTISLVLPPVDKSNVTIIAISYNECPEKLFNRLFNLIVRALHKMLF